MVEVPHDQPIRLSFSTPRRFRMESTAVPTSCTASGVRMNGALSWAGWLICRRPMEKP